MTVGIYELIIKISVKKFKKIKKLKLSIKHIIMLDKGKR